MDQKQLPGILGQLRDYPDISLFEKLTFVFDSSHEIEVGDDGSIKLTSTALRLIDSDGQRCADDFSFYGPCEIKQLAHELHSWYSIAVLADETARELLQMFAPDDVMEAITERELNYSQEEMRNFYFQIGLNRWEKPEHRLRMVKK